MTRRITRRSAIGGGAWAATALLGLRLDDGKAQEATASPIVEAFQVPGYPPLSPYPAPLEIVEDRGGTALVRDAFGEVVEIPRDPPRVVALDETMLELLLALGITPVAAGHFGTRFPVAVDGLTEGVVSLPNRDSGIDLEAVLALEPDLIVASVTELAPTFLGQARQIAPTLVLDWVGLFWPHRLGELGRALGREDAAREAVAAFAAAAAAARETVDGLAGQDATFDAILFFPDSVWHYAPVVTVDGETYLQAATRWLYGDLRRAPSTSARDLIPAGEHFVQLSFEVLPQLAGDYLVVFPGGYEATAAPGYEEFVADPFWQTIPAVRDGKALTLYADRANGYYSTRYAIDRFIRELTALASGTPAAGTATP